MHLFQHRKTRLNVANARITWSDVVDQSPLLMQLLFGVTTLRVTCFSFALTKPRPNPSDRTKVMNQKRVMPLIFFSSTKIRLRAPTLKTILLVRSSIQRRGRLYEPLGIRTAAPRGNEIRANEEHLCFFMA